MAVMKKLDVMIEGLRGESYYPGASVDLSEIALAINNSGGGICWKLTLKSGKEITVKPCKNDYGFSFEKLLEEINFAKMG